MAAAEAEANRLSVAVDDLGSGLWSGRVKQELEARTPLRNVLFSPSPSRPAVSVEELPVRYLDARSDPQLARLRQLAHSPAAWFRSPFVLVVLVSCGDYEDYKRDLRLRLKAMADTEVVAAGQPELLFVYVRPAAADAAAKGPARVFDAMRKDLNKARRERCVRLDPLTLPPTQPTAPAIAGLEEFDRAARDALRAAFESRAAAYGEEVRRLTLNRLDPAWSFPTFFLVKDGLAAMLEAAGLAEDALREYAELEACYLEVAQAAGQQQPFGGKPAGQDEASLLWSPWAATRHAASQPELPPQFLMRQALFASQARLLLKLHRHAEVADRGLKFVRAFGALLARQQRAGGVPPLLREAWSFACYLSLAEATSRLQAARAEERRKSDHPGRPGGRRGRQSEATAGTPHAGDTPRGGPAWEWDSASQRPVPSPSPSAASPLAGTSHSRLQVRVGPHSVGGGSEVESVASPEWQRGGGGGGDHATHTHVDWQLGALPGRPAAAAAAVGAEGAAEGLGGGGGGAAPGSANLYCLLAKLYCAARAELLRLGAAAGLEVPDCAAAQVLGLESPHHAAAPAPLAATPAAEADAPRAASPPAPPLASPAVEAAPEPAAGLRSSPRNADLSHVDLNGSSSSSASEQQEAPAGGDRARGEGLGTGPVTLLSAPDMQLDSQAEAEPQQQSPGAAAAPVRQLSVRPKGQGLGEGDSPSSSPHSTSTSTSTHQSSLSPTRGESGRAAPLPAAGGAAAAGAPPSAPSSARSEQNDMQTVERQVVSALASRSGAGHVVGPAAPPAPAGASAAASLPPWLVHWRLRAALSSEHLFTELFVELSEAAAACYTQCGHARNAALLHADVADALARGGSLARAADLYEGQCRAFLREGWHALAAHTLPKLAACQLAIGSAGLAHTAAALLSLPAPFRGMPPERQAACQLLLQAARSAAGLAGCRPLLPGSPPPPGALLDPVVSLTAAIVATPPHAAVSRFFGRTGPGGAPLLAPPPGGPGGGALAAAVGDALAVQVVVDNQLALPLPLRGVALTLAVLQEMTVIHSPRAAPSPVLVLGSAARPPRGGTPATPLGDSLLSLNFERQESGGQERYESRWQQVEELYCPLVAITPPSAAPGRQDGPGGGPGPRLQPLRGEAVLPPGASVLTFLAAPVKRGLYKALHLRARLHQLALQVAVQPPEPLWQQPGTAAGRRGSSAAASRRGSRAGTAGGTPLAPEPRDAPHCAEAVVMYVEQAQARIHLELLAAGGSLVAGQEQWVGLAVAPRRDALHAALLELTWPLGHPGSGGLGLPPLSRKPTAAAPHHRAVHSHGGDMRLGGASSAALQASLAAQPFLRPEHCAAALLPAAGGAATQPGGEGGSRTAPAAQLLPAEGPSGPSAAWLLAEGLRQHLALPLVEDGRPVTLWWRVMAGEVAAAPEQVHIAPPAPRHSSRQLELRRLGLPADPGPLPAAVLDVPASLEYASGCQRSHSRLLCAAVRQPFAVACAARELPSGGVALQCTLSSSMAVPAQLSRLALEPQPGFAVASSLLDSMGLLPATLPPFGSLTASFLLAPEPGVAAGADFTPLPAKLQPSALVVDYSIDSRQQCSLPAAALSGGGASGGDGGLGGRGRDPRPGAGAGGSPTSGAAEAGAAGGVAGAAGTAQTPALAVLELLDASGRQRPSSPLGSPGKRSTSGSPTATASGAALGVDGEGPGGCATRQLCCFRHLLTLEMPASEDDSSGALVYVRQLGPFVATVGQPTTLCWRLERSGTADQQQQATRMGFEVLAESDHWRPLGRRFGGVTLGGHDGAVATVEATWVPLAAGTLPVPTLRLQDVAFQEVFDVGLSLSGTNAITVVDAY